MKIDTPAALGPALSPESSQPVVERQQAIAGAQVLQFLPEIAALLAFLLLFAKPITMLAQDWWSLPEAGHGLLLAPVAIWLAWRAGVGPERKPRPFLGIALIVFAVLVRVAAGLAAERFTMRGSMVIALVGLVVFYFGIQQVLRWWLPFVLLCLSIPLPELVTQALALPLQFKASRMGASLLEMRGVPVLLTGNVIRLPGHELFVTEACSGLRSLTALLSMSVLMGALLLRTPLARIALLLLAIPIAIFINGIRVFLTGFLVYFVSPSFGEGFMHITEGWLLFLVSLALLALWAWLGIIAERKLTPRFATHDA